VSEIFARLGVNICPAQLNSLSHAADAGSGVFSLMDMLFRAGYACSSCISPTKHFTKTYPWM